MGREYLTVHRQTYDRKVRGAVQKVRAATFKIQDRGLPGRGPKLIPIRRTGALVKLGYSVKDDVEERNEALRKAVKRYGQRAVQRMLQAQANLRSRVDKTLGERFAADAERVSKGEV